MPWSHHTPWSRRKRRRRLKPWRRHMPCSRRMPGRRRMPWCRCKAWDHRMPRCRGRPWSRCKQPGRLEPWEPPQVVESPHASASPHAVGSPHRPWGCRGSEQAVGSPQDMVVAALGVATGHRDGPGQPMTEMALSRWAVVGRQLCGPRPAGTPPCSLSARCATTSAGHSPSAGTAASPRPCSALARTPSTGSPRRRPPRSRRWWVSSTGPRLRSWARRCCRCCARAVRTMSFVLGQSSSSSLLVSSSCGCRRWTWSTCLYIYGDRSAHVLLMAR